MSRARPTSPVFAVVAFALAVSLSGGPLSAPARAEGPTIPNAILGGRVTLRGGLPDAGATVNVVRADNSGSFGTTTDQDGAWSLPVAPGQYHVVASSPHGLAMSWPDIPEAWGADAGTLITATSGQSRDDVSFSLRPRGPHAAYDEYGRLQAGSDGSGDVDPTAPWYPLDDVRPAGRITGPRIALQAPRNSQVVPVADQTDLIAFTGTGAGFDLPVQNTGDDALLISNVRFEGPDAKFFSCHLIARMRCGPRAAVPGESMDLSVYLAADEYRSAYRATVVFDTNTPAGTQRIPVSLRNLLPEGVRVTDVPNPLGALLGYLPPGTIGALLQRDDRTTAALSVAASTVARRVQVTRDRVSAAFPTPGTATIAIDRRARTHARWRPFRTTTLRARKAGTVRRRVRALPAGRYRIRVRATLDGGHARTATLTRTVRR